jgi:hypothetical protein
VAALFCRAWALALHDACRRDGRAAPVGSDDFATQQSAEQAFRGRLAPQPASASIAAGTGHHRIASVSRRLTRP